jgi:dTDP-4-amino-4,6-dideoxygalactose transaminase
MAMPAVSVIRPPQPGPIPVARPLLPDADALAPYLRQIDESRWYSNFGPLLRAFEDRLEARFAQPTRVATVANGTLAITLALQALGCRPGELCAMPAWTFVATAHAVRQAGLQPWFLDVDPQTWMLDPAQTVAALRTAPGPVGAIVPVSAFGALPNLQAWANVRDATGVPVLVDGAAAFDALNEAPVPVTVSLHATKSVAAGEGGFVASEDEALIERVRALTAFAFQGERTSRFVATNAKLSEYAAAVGLASLDAWPATRARLSFAALQLKVALALTPQIVFQPGWGVSWISSVCVVGVPDGIAARLARDLAAQGAEARAWWGAGCHVQPAFEDCLRQPLPITERLAGSTLGLPYFIDLDEPQAWRIVDALIAGLEEPALG